MLQLIFSSRFPHEYFHSFWSGGFQPIAALKKGLLLRDKGSLSELKTREYMYCMSPDFSVFFSCTYSWLTEDIKARGLYPACCRAQTRFSQSLAKCEMRPRSEIVNKIISHAQHILWARAISLCLPPVALFTKKPALCVSCNYRKDHLCQEPKKKKKK